MSGFDLPDFRKMLIWAVLAAVALTAAVMLVLFWLASGPQSDLQAEAIERGYAHYCSNNGEWAWKGECE